MKTLEFMARESKTFQQFTKDYLTYLAALLQRIDLDAVAAFVEELQSARKHHKTVFFIGNGGSVLSLHRIWPTTLVWMS